MRDGRRRNLPLSAEAAGAAIVFCVVAPETERVDRFLADQLGLSRTQAARLVAAKGVSVGGTAIRASRRLTRGEAWRHEQPSDAWAVC